MENRILQMKQRLVAEALGKYCDDLGGDRDCRAVKKYTSEPLVMSDFVSFFFLNEDRNSFRLDCSSTNNTISCSLMQDVKARQAGFFACEATMSPSFIETDVEIFFDVPTSPDINGEDGHVQDVTGEEVPHLDDVVEGTGPNDVQVEGEVRDIFTEEFDGYSDAVCVDHYEVGDVADVVESPSSGMITIPSLEEAAYMGYSVHVDGDKLIAGAPGNIDIVGAAYIFEKQVDGKWSNTAKITDPTPGEGFYFGGRVLLCGDTAFVSENDSVEVFYNPDGATWYWLQSMASGPCSIEGFPAVATLDDCETILVGAPCADVSGEAGPVPLAGKVMQYRRDGSVWKNVGDIISPSPVENGAFGVAISSNGDIMIAGESGLYGALGCAHAFVRTGDASWEHSGILCPQDASFAHYVTGTAVSDNMAYVLTNLDWQNEGYGYIQSYVLDDVTGWGPHKAFYDPDVNSNANFATSMAVSGTSVLVGASRDPNYLVGSRAYLFKCDAGLFLLEKTFKPQLEQYEESFGHSVHTDGKTIVIGEPERMSKVHYGPRAGAIYVFDVE